MKAYVRRAGKKMRWLPVMLWFDPVSKKVESHGIKGHRAALLFRETGNDERFLETVCRNRGMRVKVFTEPDDAPRWLMAE